MCKLKGLDVDFVDVVIQLLQGMIRSLSMQIVFWFEVYLKSLLLDVLERLNTKFNHLNK